MRQITKGKVLATALVLGLMTAALVYYFLASKAREARANTQVVIAAQEIPRGTVISADMLRETQMMADGAEMETASSTEMVIGKVAKDRFGAGEPIALAGIRPRDHFAYIIPPFMRAVTVALDPIIGVGGFLKPGDHVDVVATFNVNDGSVTKTVLQDVELLATGAEMVSAEGGKREEPTAQPNATLAVMPTDAEKLILAESKGKLRLTLRRPDDTSFVETKGITGRTMLGQVPPDVPEKSQGYAAVYQPSPPITSAVDYQAPKLEPLAPPEPSGKTIMIIRGTKVEEAIVQE